MERSAIALFLLSLTACTGTSLPEAPKGAVAWCGNFDYTGTWLKTESSGSVLGLSDKDLADKLTVEDILTLTEQMGCNQ